MAKAKTTYLNAVKKRRTRNFLFEKAREKREQKFMFESIVGLPGPDIDFYVNDFETMGVTNFEMYEYKKDLIFTQMTHLLCVVLLNFKNN
jgi:hypothetical protein